MIKKRLNNTLANSNLVNSKSGSERISNTLPYQKSAKILKTVKYLENEKQKQLEMQANSLCILYYY